MALIGALVPQLSFADEKGDVAKGQTVFEQLCGICHSASADGSGPTMGPNLFGLIGRKVASEPNFAMYSPALKALGAEWSIKALDEFLKDPLAKVPGTTMPVTLPNRQERADVIAYLASLK